MTTPNSQRTAPLTSLHAETLRLTAFPLPTTRLGETSWWNDLVGTQPERKVSRPRKEEYREEGPYKDRNLVLQVQLNRIDWNLLQIADKLKEPEALPSIGPFLDSLEVFVPLILRWLEMAPPIQRLAFGAVLLVPVGDRQEGYQQISAYLPSVQLDPKRSGDFFYQINRPRPSTSGISGLTINRLSRWSVASFKKVEYVIGPQSTQQFPGEETVASRIELDISTAADFQDELPRERLPAILKELVNLGEEIAHKGDIP